MKPQIERKNTPQSGNKEMLQTENTKLQTRNNQMAQLGTLLPSTRALRIKQVSGIFNGALRVRRRNLLYRHELRPKSHEKSCTIFQALQNSSTRLQNALKLTVRRSVPRKDRIRKPRLPRNRLPLLRMVAMIKI
jgi:hypothetical protein